MAKGKKTNTNPRSPRDGGQKRKQVIAPVGRTLKMTNPVPAIHYTSKGMMRIKHREPVAFISSATSTYTKTTTA